MSAHTNLRTARHPRYWRPIEVAGARYLWQARLGQDKLHSAVRVAIQECGPAPARARTASAGHGTTLLVDTPIGGAERCGSAGLARPRPIGPRHVAECIVQARDLGWLAGAGAPNVPFVCLLDRALFLDEDRVSLTRDLARAERPRDGC